MGEPIKPGTTPSLPGAMSTRTDGGPASKQAIRYAAGEPGAEDFVNLQRQAPLAKTQTAKPMAKSQIVQAAEANAQLQQSPQPVPNPVQAIPLGAPTQNPMEPVTNGAPIGAGAGSEALILPNPIQAQYENAYQMFNQMAANPDASPALKYLAMRIGQGF